MLSFYLGAEEYRKRDTSMNQNLRLRLFKDKWWVRGVRAEVEPT